MGVRLSAAVIAAGKGERMQASGIRVPKPLIPVGGRPLLLRVLDAYRGLGAAEAVIITNRRFGPRLKAAVAAERWPFRVRWIVKTTPSSFHSFREIARALAGRPFLLSTVDALCPPRVVRGFARRALALNGAETVLGVTALVHDEKPLWVRLGPRRRIVAMGPEAARSGWVTAGLYFFRPAALKGGLGSYGALREFLTAGTARGRTWAVDLGRVVDVDRPEDIRLAERLLRKG